MFMASKIHGAYEILPGKIAVVRYKINWWYHSTKTLIWGNTLPTISFSVNRKALSAWALEKCEI